MEFVTLHVEAFHLVVADATTGWVFPAIQSARDLQSLCGSGLSDEVDDGFLIAQWLAAPIGGDEGEQPVFDPVPFAGAGRKVTDREAQACLISKLLQLQLPQP